ncbi:hypothetical protein Tco_0749566 [Tanacetum coccineum]|uniref:Uncharacterized protein n=1 Tax=Tanacetum coccineum TaxID=301880 RepID=A0ABQ4YZ16_9ASTR
MKNLVFHSKTNHIEIRHHFIRDSYEKKLIQVIKIHIDYNVADLLAKAFDVSRLDERECNIKKQWVKDEIVYKEWEDIMEMAATTTSSLEAEQDSGSGPRCQDSILGGAEAQSRFEAASKQSNDPPLSRVNTLGSREDNMKLLELMEHCTTLFELATTKVKTVNGERQLQALVDKKKVIITEASIRSDLKLEDAGGTDCLPTATIFEELARMGAKTTAWNEFSSTMASAIICLATNQKFNLSKYIFDAMAKNLEGWVKFLMYTRFVQVFINQQLGDMSHHKETYVNPSHTKKIFANMKRAGKDFSGRVTPLFAIVMVQANQEEGVDSDIPTDSQQTPIISQPSSSKHQKKKSRRKQRKDSAPTDPTAEETPDEAHVSTPSYDLSQSGEDRMQLHELINLCTKLSDRVLALETTKSNQALEIERLKRRVKSLEKRKKSRTSGFKRLRKGRKIVDLDVDAEVTLEKDVAEKEVSVADPVTTAGEVVTTANVEVTTVNAPTTTIDELTLAQTLIEIKAAKPKVVTSAATTTTTTRPKARWVVVQEPSEFKTTSSSLQASQLPQAKDKGKGIMVEPEVPFKKKDQVALDEEMARNLKAQLQVEHIKEERLARQKEEEANIALLESWDNTQAMMDADFQLAQQMQTKEQE